MSKKEELAYLAGIIDGEGCIGIKKRIYKQEGWLEHSIRISMKMTERTAIDLFQMYFGGNIKKIKPNTKNGKDLFVIEIVALKAKKALELLLPYLRIKKLQATLAIKLQGIKNKNKKGHLGDSQSIKIKRLQREKMYEEMKRLNQIGKGVDYL